ncbi:UbiA-like protein EboC [Aquimarina agarilytica]|uniref:UbiA-like protein EboC n=1 Tax=Aquimarina agarilytica TaxID=1087449 RepID=UPI0012FC5681|nr:UbiA-like protein EboC [Aquimarina agarilytica]
MARPANILTAISDIIAGFSVAGIFLYPLMDTKFESMILLIVSTMGLYAGGIIFNDVFDYKADKLNRPERMLPSGKISMNEAIIFGSSLFAIGVISAFLVSTQSGIIAFSICILALTYDKYAKHHSVLGPINMGLCRSMNLLLGMSIINNVIPLMWFLGCIPLAFIAAITLVGQKEAHGNNKNSIIKAIILDTLVVLFFIFLMLYGYLKIWTTIPFLLFWFGINLIAKARALIHNHPKQIQQAVKIGVLSLIPLNAIYVVGFANWYYALLLICLLPISMLVAKHYAVT